MKSLKKSLLLFVISVSVLSSSIFSQGITFSLANGQVTTDGATKYYEFDIMAVASSTTQFYIAQVYIDYNTAGFGSSIYSNSKVSVSAGEITSGTFQGTPPNFGSGTYNLTISDNTASKLAVQNDHVTFIGGTYSGRGYELANTLSTTAKVYAHIKIEIADQSKNSEISLDATIDQFDQQQYYYTTPGADATAKYNPVNVGSGLNEALPVELTSFTASISNGVELNWETATEVNNYGFEIEREYQISSSEYQDSSWEKIGFVNGNGTTNSPKSYSFLDENLPDASAVSYRLKQIDLDGAVSYSKVITVDISNITNVEEEIPVEYSLSQNFPNPFNPSTTIKFGLPETGYVDLRVYNILGEEVAHLISKEMSAGYHTVNFGSNSIPSGIYIYTINMNGKFSSVKKMLLVK